MVTTHPIAGEVKNTEVAENIFEKKLASSPELTDTKGMEARP